MPKSFRNFFLSYLVIFAVPAVILSFFSYTLLIDQFKTLVYNSAEESYRNNMYQFDNNIQQLEDIAFHLSAKNGISPYNLDTNVGNRIEIIEMLKYSLAIGNGIDDIILYLDNENLIYSTQGTFTISNYSDIYKVNLSKIVEYISDPTRSSNRLFPIIMREIPIEGKYQYFSCKYPFNSSYPAGQLIFKVNMRKFVPFNGDSYIVYYENNAFYKNINPQLLDANKASLMSGIANSDDSVNMPFPYISTLSEISDIRVATVIDSKEVFRTFYKTRYNFIITETLVFAISIFLLSYFSYKNYKPLSDLKNTLIKLGIKLGNNYGENYEISKSIETLEILASNNKILDNQILQFKYRSRELLLSKIVYNQYVDIEKVKKELEQYDVIINDPFYTVCVFKVHGESLPNFYINDFSLANANNNINIYFCNDIDNRILALIGGNKNMENKLDTLIDGIIKKMNENGILAEAYLGRVYSSITQMDLSYIEAVSMINYDRFSNRNINTYKQCLSPEKYLLYPQIELNNLANALASSDSSNIILTTKTIAHQLLSGIYDFSYSKTICYDVINTIIKTLNEEDDETFSSIRKFLSDLNKINKKSDICKFITGIGVDIAEMKSKDNPSLAIENKIDRIIAYINEHYLDNDFFLGEVADKFHISINNLSQQLKKQLNMSPSRYITTLRINKAKELLSTTEDTINEISYSVGYSSVSSFIRNFKTITSLTPSQYRDGIQHI